ncbi:gamma-glutamylcyclotransferase [Spongiibacter sp. KMU-158]|uniref:Gamma-glutamylcyclotransferase n=2 Tax=Spongiibacter pelagi TaxID=2760804 RepID=A0A927C1N5_9GAMM|nr:gamma-glutamylcyclotransferase [Spongiibacter pelagi]
MNPARMQARGLYFHTARSGSLPGYRLRFNKESHASPGVAYANIEPFTTSSVEGVLYELADPAAIALMDGFEGTPVRYSRECLHVHTAQGLELAWVYLANPAFINNQIIPESRYLAHLLAGEAFLSEAYMQQLQSQDCLPSEIIEGEAGLKFNV